jgi:hypothetical protein
LESQIGRPSIRSPDSALDIATWSQPQLEIRANLSLALKYNKQWRETSLNRLNDGNISNRGSQTAHKKQLFAIENAQCQIKIFLEAAQSHGNLDFY